MPVGTVFGLDTLKCLNTALTLHHPGGQIPLVIISVVCLGNKALTLTSVGRTKWVPNCALCALVYIAADKLDLED